MTHGDPDDLRHDRGRKARTCFGFIHDEAREEAYGRRNAVDARSMRRPRLDTRIDREKRRIESCIRFSRSDLHLQELDDSVVAIPSDHE